MVDESDRTTVPRVARDCAMILVGMRPSAAVIVIALLTLGCSSNPTRALETAAVTVGTPTLDSRPTVGRLKPPVKKIATPGRRVQSLDTAKGAIRVGQKMIDVYDKLSDPAIEDTEDDDYTLVTSIGQFPGLKWVKRYVISDGRSIVVRYARRLPRRPFKMVSDNQSGAGDRQNKQYPYLIEEIVIE